MDKSIFWGSVATLFIMAIPFFVVPETTSDALAFLKNSIDANFSYVFTWLAIIVLLVCAWVVLSRLGGIKLGSGKPDFSMFSWGSMLFCAGVATGILYWGTIEWAYYVNTPPFGIEPDSDMAFEWSATYGMFHWGIAGWAFYAVPALVLGHGFYNIGFKELRISTACRGVLGKYADGLPGKVIDIFFMIGLLASSGTSLGLGTPMVVAGLNDLFGTGTSFAVNLLVVLICASIFATSVSLGITRGIKRLSNLNVSLAFLFLTFVLIAGPTAFILKMTTNSIGLLTQNFVRMLTWSDPIAQTSFVEDWTIFYWSWWIAVGPFMGIFIAKISKGRTFRQVTVGTVLFGSAGCALFYGILGNYAMSVELSGQVSSISLIQEGSTPEAIIGVIGTLPGGSITILFFVIMSIIFMATSFDSTSYVLATTSSINSYKEPARWQRLFWAFLLILLPTGLLYIGGLNSLKTMVLISALPLILVYIFMIASLVKWTYRNVDGNEL